MIQAPKPEPRIMRDELTDHEWAAIGPMLEACGLPRVNDRRVLPDNFGPYTTCYNRSFDGSGLSFGAGS
jgi:hypothetical protein